MQHIDPIERVKLRREMNEAIDCLMRLCTRLDLKACYESLRDTRAFLARQIDLVPAREAHDRPTKPE